MTRVVVVGATKNFFKVGHATFRELALTRPDVDLRLGILDITDAARAVVGINVELIAWSPEQERSIDRVLADCSAMLMVPPIDGRVRVSRLYIEAAKRAGVGYVLCLGIQHPAGRCVMGQESSEVADMLAAAGIPFDMLRLPMFLENLLYQIPSISKRGYFRYPVSADAPFSYLTCGDLGKVFARIVTDPPPSGLRDTLWTGSEQLTCQQWADHLSRAVAGHITFRPQPGEEFVRGLMDKGMSEHASRAILQLWEEVGRGGDILPSDTFAKLLGTRPTSAAQWTAEHACCFGAPAQSPCPHPKPPREHMT